ncbi:hypothetical protein DP117_18985 [Brasilonema sp. UFV-L1]|nr:hypothetical protein [Brasilonema sp. UFV-L1]
MVSPMQNTLPLSQYMARRVVVCFYSDKRWIPIMFYSLEDAISLYYKALRLGKKLFVFPSNCYPCGNPNCPRCISQQQGHSYLEVLHLQVRFG